MSTLSLQISLRCGACGVVVPVNGLAPEATCWSCDTRTPIGAGVWSLILREPLAEARTLPPEVQRAGTLATDIGTLHRVHHTGPPRCGGCQATLDPAFLLGALGQRAAAAACPSCRHAVAVRAAPPELAAQGVAAVVGETEGHRKQRDPVPLACATCGGGLNVDGRERLVRCPFCGGQQALPNELLLALRSTPVRPFWLVFGDGAAFVPQRTLATWTSVGDAVVDHQGNLYLWGTAVTASADGGAGRRAMGPGGPPKPGLDPELMEALAGLGGGDSLFSVAPDLTLRWKLDGLPFASGNTRVAFARSGHLVVSDGARAEVRRCDTGELVLRFSGREGEGARLALGRMSQLVVDADGTLVAWTFDDELLRRFDPTGHPIAMWGAGPPRDGSREVASDPWGPMVFQLGGTPSRAHDVILAAGWDGHLYLQSSLNMESSCHLAAYDRAGHRLYTAAVGVQAPTFKARPAIDGYGRAYVRLPNEGGNVYRVEGRGKNVVLFARARAAGGLFGGEHHIACTPDGSLFAIGAGGSLRIFTPEGRVAFLSPGAIAADQRRADAF
jgi:DNA-directed RNA polymerase subunit RPC12/RpoP